MVTTETSFFRDLHPFETLRTTVVPDLMRRRAGEKRLEVWCAACSTGQEPYSLAILLREHFPTLKIRFVNVVDLYKLMPATEHPHGLSDQDFDAIREISKLGLKSKIYTFVRAMTADIAAR